MLLLLLLVVLLMGLLMVLLVVLRLVFGRGGGCCMHTCPAMRELNALEGDGNRREAREMGLQMA